MGSGGLRVWLLLDYMVRSVHNAWVAMNQNVSTKQASLPQQDLPESKLDIWTVLLDALIILSGRWKLLIVGPLIAGAVAYAGAFLLPKSYLSYAYVGPLDEATARKTSSLILSPSVLDAVLRKFPQPPFSSMTMDEARLYLAERVGFTLAPGGDPKLPSLYILKAMDSQPARARDLLTAIIDSWLVAMKAPPDKLASLQRLQEGIDIQSADLSSAITRLMNHPELLSGDVKTGYAPVNVADMIKLRTDGISKSEDLRTAMAGPGRDVIVSPPTMPTTPVGPLKRKIVAVVAGSTLAFLIVLLLVRDFLLPLLANTAYGPKLQRISNALRLHKVRS
jgi:hypothetical protein